MSIINGVGTVGWRNYVSPLLSPLWNNLTQYYTADSTSNDAKGNFNGTLVNGATYATGKIGSAFSFDGINDYMSTATNSPFDSYYEHTYSCWVKPASNSIGIFMGNGTSMLGVRAGRSLTFFQYYVNAEVNSGYILPLNTWTHVAVTYKGAAFGANNVLFYVNGSLVYTGTLSMPSGVGKIFLGSNNAGSGGFYNGLLDEAGVWNRALTATEVTELYSVVAGKQYAVLTYPALWNNLKAYFTADNNSNDATGVYRGTCLNGATYATGKINNGFSLDGINDCVSISNIPYTSTSLPFSFSCWFNLTKNGTLYDNIDGALRGWNIWMSSSYMYVRLASGPYPTEIRTRTTNTLSFNTMYHLTITYSGNTNASGINIYINGSLVSKTTQFNGCTVAALSPNSNYIGTGYFGGTGGLIDEVGIWDRELTATDVTQLYNGGTGKQYPN